MTTLSIDGKTTYKDLIPVLPVVSNASGGYKEQFANVLDLVNSTAAPLGIGGVFTGAHWVDVLDYSQVSVLAYSDVASAVGGLVIQFSSDGFNVDHTHGYNVEAGNGEHIRIDIHAKYYRIIYTNGPAAQTSFRLQTILNVASSNGSVIEAEHPITGKDDCLLTKAILTGLNASDRLGYVDVNAAPDGAIMVNQNTTVDAASSSVANLSAGATFTGPSVSDLFFTAVQYTLKTDQFCYVYVEQSPDGTNWDISDRYEAFPGIGSGNTVQLVASYYRIRVTNNGVIATTYFRLQVIQIPFLPSLPRSLDLDGYLAVGIESFKDQNGFIGQLSPNGETLSVPTYRLIGSAFPNGVLDTVFWTPSLGTGGSAAPVNGQLVVTTGTTANNSVSVVSVATARYVVGQANKFKANLQLPDPGTVNNTRRIGVFTVNDGAFFEVSGTLVSLVTRKGGVETSRTPNGSFNGKMGATVPTGSTKEHIYEIVYNLQTVYFMVDGVISHTAKFDAAWTATLDLPIRIENFNSNGSTTNVVLNVLGATVMKLGIAQTQPVSDFQQGLTAGRQLKIGAGNIHGIVLSGITNNSVATLYDGTSTAGRVLWSSGALTSNGLPFEIDMKGAAFYTGLFLAVTGANVNVLSMYE